MCSERPDLSNQNLVRDSDLFVELLKRYIERGVTESITNCNYGEVILRPNLKLRKEQ